MMVIKTYRTTSPAKDVNKKISVGPVFDLSCFGYMLKVNILLFQIQVNIIQSLHINMNIAIGFLNYLAVSTLKFMNCNLNN